MAIETKKTTPTARRKKTGRRKQTTPKTAPADTETTNTSAHEAKQVDVGEVHTAGKTPKTAKKRRKRTTKKKSAVLKEQAEPTLAPESDAAETTAKKRPARRSRSRQPRDAAKRTTRESSAEKKTTTAARGADIFPFVDAPSPTGRTKSPNKKTESREMIINVSQGYECRVAVLHNGKLEEIFIERTATQSSVGNIYKGIVTNVEPSIQAAFIDFGREKNGFLHISDVQPQYFPDHSGPGEDVGRKTPRHNRPPIQKCFRRGQEVIVQITKEGVGTKGPTLTSYISIPGRFLVMMPGMSRHGVSRKIEDEDARRRMRDIMKELELPAGMGCILRTAGLDRTKRDLQRDLTYLQRLWKTVADRVKKMAAPAELYRESDLVTRTIRDVYSSDFARLVVDDEATARRAREFLRIAMPRTKTHLEHYTDREPLFHKMGIEAELERINLRQVPLASGGSIVIDSTEALVAIDVNSGRFRSVADAEETALRINVEAAEEIARQLRLRDLGGLIICDFIDMRFDRNKRKVEATLRDALKIHKERARILKMSAFGLIEMTRQRQGPSTKRNTYHDCPACYGSGLVKMPQTVILDAMRALQLAANDKNVATIRVSLAPPIAFELLNAKRNTLSDIEKETGKKITVVGEVERTGGQVTLVCKDNRGREIVPAGGNLGLPLKPPPVSNRSR